MSTVDPDSLPPGPRPLAPARSVQRLHATDRGRQLLETALDVFSQKGYQGSTTKEIAAAAGVTEAIIFRHFPTKNDLYSAVLDLKHESGEIAANVAEWQTLMDANDDRGLFRAIIHKVIDSYRRDPRHNRVLLYAALEGHEAGLEQHRQRSFPLYERLCQYVARRQREGVFRPGHPGALIVAAVGPAAYYAQMNGLFGFASGIEDSQISEEFLNVLMKGIQA
jgi:TetR/AcrR family transcriptional regulator